MTSAFHSIPAQRDTPLFIFGDHASNVIPEDLGNLGLSGQNLLRHIAWDIGTETLVRELCHIFGCGGHVAAFSRLVIDPNRGLELPSLIPVVSDGTLIPGNQELSDAARQSRIDRFYQPYHDGLSAALEAAPKDSLVISVHSFTKKPREGTWRGRDIGLLVKHDQETARACKEMFGRLGQHFDVGINEPYSAYDLNHTIDTHVASQGMRHLAIEVRQDHIDTDRAAKAMARVLEKVLHPIVHGSYAAA